MQNLFQLICYTLFGKHWLKWDMIQGYKGAIFANEMEIDMQKAKLEILEDNLKDLEAQLKTEEDSEITEALVLEKLPEDQREDKKAVYDMEKKLKGERAERISALRNRISSNKDDLDRENGEMGKIYATTYKNRMKYDFIRGYKIKKTYADLNK